MPIPEPLPMLRPFQEAVAYQLQREPMDADEFYALDDEARRRAFTIAGLTRQSSLIEAHRLATAAIAAGRTKQEFLEELGDVLDTEGTILPRPRLSLIAQNNTAAAYAAGRWKQLADPELAQLRPYLQYPLGPSDERTSAICRRLEGFIARHDHPVWQRIFPPNHHNERHIQVTSLTEEQARGTGRVYEGSDADDYPFVDGQRILPDPGFDAPPQLLAADEKLLAGEAADRGAELAGKTASDYGLRPIAENPTSSFPAAPGAASIDEVLADGPVLLDEFGDGLRTSRAALEDMEAIEDRILGLMRPTLSDPFETWLVRSARESGEIRYAKRYLGLYQDGQDLIGIALEASQEGWLTVPGASPAGFRIPTPQEIEQLRRGLLLRSRGRKT